MLYSLDTETTGLDFHHGSRPYFVGMCDENGNVKFWEWNVNQYTREVEVNKQDIKEILDIVNDPNNQFIMHNAKFDVKALHTIIPNLKWDWSRTHDTTYLCHLLGSNQRKDLTSAVIQYVGINIESYEEELRKVCISIRRKVKDIWKISKVGDDDSPSVKGQAWKQDAWILKKYAQENNLDKKDPTWTLLEDYAIADVVHTLLLFKELMTEVKRRKLDKIYQVRRKLLPIIYDMESVGITGSKDRLQELIRKYKNESESYAKICRDIADSYGVNIKLPKSGNSKELLDFVFDTMKVSAIVTSKKTGNPSLSRDAISEILYTLDKNTREYDFLKTLMDKRKRDTAVNYLEGYKRFARPTFEDEYFRLYPSLNVVGTDTLRFSSQNPNEQNISKKDGFNLRYCFGPLPDREWWSIDAQNIELRIPAYVSQEQAMIDLFEKPDTPPYFGSNHSLIAHVLHKEKFESCINDNGEIDGTIFKERYKEEYQRVKNGNFAVQYGAMEESGTADRAYGIKGAQRIVQTRFNKQAKLNQQCIDKARKLGYIETIPDINVDPTKGYPLLITRWLWGDIKPTIPLNFFVQGTAMWWMMKAMIRCYEYLQELNNRGDKKYYIIMQVHDELVFDFPKGKGKEPWKTNLPKIRKIKQLMEMGGKDINIPTPVSVEYCAETWAESVKIKA